MSRNGGPTTAWERTVRRREVIRLKLGKKMTAQEIADELGWNVQTIRKDFQWIDGHVQKLEDEDFLRQEILTATMHLMDHETQDLRDADRENDAKAKHNAKQSMRSTLKMLNEMGGEGSVDEAEAEMDAEEYISQLPDELKSDLAEYAGKEVDEILAQE